MLTTPCCWEYRDSLCNIVILWEVIAACGVSRTRLSNINLPFKRKSPGICQAREQKKSRREGKHQSTNNYHWKSNKDKHFIQRRIFSWQFLLCHVPWRTRPPTSSTAKLDKYSVLRAEGRFSVTEMNWGESSSVPISSSKYWNKNGDRIFTIYFYFNLSIWNK